MLCIKHKIFLTFGETLKNVTSQVILSLRRVPRLIRENQDLMRDEPLTRPSIRRDREKDQPQELRIPELLQPEHDRHFLKTYSEERPFDQPRIHQNARVHHRFGPELFDIRHDLRRNLSEALEEGRSVNILDRVHAQERLVHVLGLLFEELAGV